MKLHAPFKISARLGPALKIGDSWLTLLTIKLGSSGRERATFAIDTPDFEYVDSELQSGVGGFTSMVEAFETYLGFLEASAEACFYGPKSENYDLFPPNVTEWAHAHSNDLSMARSDICDENGNVLEDLITL
jgi:hypothetical protein